MADEPRQQSQIDQSNKILAWATRVIDEKSRQAYATLAVDLEKRINDQLDRDRTFIKDVLAAALKVAGAGLVLVVFILGALTWTTYKNIHDSVISAARGGVEKQLKDPETKRTIDGIVDRGILDAFLLRIALHDTKNDSGKPLSEADLDVARVIKLMTSKDTDRATFESAAEVLIRVCPTVSGDEIKDSRADAILNACAAIVRAKDKGFEWAVERTDRRLWLLRRIAKAELANEQTRAAVRELLSMQVTVKPELRRAGINYVGAIRDTDALEAIRGLFGREKTDEFRLDSVRAIVRLKADADEVPKWCEQILQESQPTIETLGTAFEISEFVDVSLGERLIEFVSRKTAVIVNRRNPEELVLRMAPRPKGHNPGNPVSKKPLLGEDKTGSPVVLNLLQKYGAQSDLVEFTRFVKWINPRVGVFQVNARLEGDAALCLSNDAQVNKSVVPRGVSLSTKIGHVANGKLGWVLIGTWTDPQDAQKSATENIVGIVDPKQIKFSVTEGAVGDGDEHD